MHSSKSHISTPTPCLPLLFSCPVLAVGYSNGCVSLLDVEDGHCLHDLSVGEEITTLLWAEQEKGTSDSSRYIQTKFDVNNFNETHCVI